MLFVAAIGLALTAATAVAQSPADGLIGYRAFDEGDLAVNSTRSAPDIFGKTGAAKIIGPVWTEGRHGAAMDFSDGETAVIVDKTAELDCERQITIAAWIKLDNPQGRGMILSHEYSYRLSVNGGGKRRVRLQLNLDGNWAQNRLVSNTSLETDRWYCVAGRVLGAAMCAGGVSAGPATAPTYPPTSRPGPQARRASAPVPVPAFRSGPGGGPSPPAA